MLKKIQNIYNLVFKRKICFVNFLSAQKKKRQAIMRLGKFHHIANMMTE